MQLQNVKFHLYISCSFWHLQAQVNVIGSVTCKENCGSSVYVTLVRLSGSRNKESKTLRLADQSNEFLFPKVLPGKYRLEVLMLFCIIIFPFILYISDKFSFFTLMDESSLSDCPIKFCYYLYHIFFFLKFKCHCITLLRVHYRMVI